MDTETERERNRLCAAINSLMYELPAPRRRKRRKTWVGDLKLSTFATFALVPVAIKIKRKRKKNASCKAKRLILIHQMTRRRRGLLTPLKDDSLMVRWEGTCEKLLFIRPSSVVVSKLLLLLWQLFVVCWCCCFVCTLQQQQQNAKVSDIIVLSGERKKNGFFFIVF